MIILCDMTASMGTLQTDGRTRWRSAVEKCNRVFDMLQDNWRISLLTVPESDKSITDFSLTKRQALSILTEFAPFDAPGNVMETYRRLVLAADAEETTAVLILSDNLLSTLPDHSLQFARTISTGGPSRNVGIVSFHIDEKAGSLFTSIGNFSDDERKPSLKLVLDGSATASRNITLRPNECKPVVFQQDLAEAHTVELILSPVDELSADNTVRAILEREDTFAVAFAGKPDSLIQKALSAAVAEVVMVAPSVDTSDFRLTVYNEVLPVGPFSPHVVLISPPSGIAAVTVGGQLKVAQPVVTRPDHWLMRHASFDGVTIEKAVELRVPDRFTRLVESEGHPLIVASGENRRSQVILAFRPSDSNWPLKASFPIFWVNALNNAINEDTASKRWSFSPTEKHPGVNLLSTDESNNTGTATLFDPDLIAQGLSALSPVKQTTTELAPWLLLLSLVSLGAFWALRKT